MDFQCSPRLFRLPPERDMRALVLLLTMLPVFPIRLEKANFEKLVTWLARLSQQNGVLVDSATIDKAGAPGIVNAAIVLHAG